MKSNIFGKYGEDVFQEHVKLWTLISATKKGIVKSILKFLEPAAVILRPNIKQTRRHWRADNCINNYIKLLAGTNILLLFTLVIFYMNR